MITNSFYTTEIAEAIKQLIIDNTTDIEAKNVVIGDLSVIPSPEEIKDYLPILLVCPIELDSDVANEYWNISRVLYPFTIYYISPYNFKLANEEMKKKIKEGEKFANILTSQPRLGDFKIAQVAGEQGGQITETKVVKVKFDNTSAEVFSQLKVPACIVEITFFAMFSTYQNGIGG